MELIDFFNKSAPTRNKWLKRNKHYNQELINFLKFHIPENKNILEIGCSTGFLLNSLKPQQGIGIDISPEMIRIAGTNYPHLKFLNADAHNFDLKEKFDYIIISDTIGYFEDVQKVLSHIRKNCTHNTRIIINNYNRLWEPIIKTAEKLKLKLKEPFTSWLSDKDIEGLLHLEHYDIIKNTRKILFPKYLPLLSTFLNKYLANLPFFRILALTNFIIARPLELTPRKELKVSIVIAARNEKGNIEKIIQSLPNLGKHTEIIFIEGGSSDGTYEEIIRIAKLYPKKNITYAKQDGKGKGDAVRKGFDMATGDILMIYDADMAVPAKDLDKFYEAIASNKGEFINGSRLVYPMKQEAMKTINLFGNKMFSLMFSWLLNQRLKDTLCGTKVLTKENYEMIKKNRSYFGNFDPFGDFDLIFGASKLGLKIVEVPMRYEERTYGDTNIRRFAHGWILIKMCMFAMRKIKFI